MRLILSEKQTRERRSDHNHKRLLCQFFAISVWVISNPDLTLFDAEIEIWESSILRHFLLATVEKDALIIP